MSLFSIFTNDQEKEVKTRIRKPAAGNSSFKISIEANLGTKKSTTAFWDRANDKMALEIPIHVSVKWHVKIWGEKGNYIFVRSSYPGTVGCHLGTRTWGHNTSTYMLEWRIRERLILPLYKSMMFLRNEVEVEGSQEWIKMKCCFWRLLSLGGKKKSERGV